MWSHQEGSPRERIWGGPWRMSFFERNDSGVEGLFQLKRCLSVRPEPRGGHMPSALQGKGAGSGCPDLACSHRPRRFCGIYA